MCRLCDRIREFAFNAKSTKQISHYGLPFENKVNIFHFDYVANVILVSVFIYPGPGKPLDIRQIDGQYEIFTLVEKTVKQNLAKLLTSENSVVVTESLLAGAIAMALCYIARIQRTKPPGCKVSANWRTLEIVNTKWFFL